MTDPETIAVPTVTLRAVLTCCRAGITPRIAWQDSRDAMISAAMEVRRSCLAQIEAELEGILPDPS